MYSTSVEGVEKSNGAFWRLHRNSCLWLPCLEWLISSMLYSAPSFVKGNVFVLLYTFTLKSSFCFTLFLPPAQDVVFSDGCAVRSIWGLKVLQYRNAQMWLPEWKNCCRCSWNLKLSQYEIVWQSRSLWSLSLCLFLGFEAECLIFHFYSHSARFIFMQLFLLLLWQKLQSAQLLSLETKEGRE